MNVVGRVGNLISQGVFSVATPFHPFGGAVDVIVVQQQDGTFRSTPWYVRFGKFQGVLKGAEKIVGINVNGVDANFHMYLDNSGEAFFLKEVDCSKECDIKDSDCVDVTTDGCNVYVDDSIKQYNGKEVEMPRLEHTMSDSAMVQLREECQSSNKRQIERSESEGDRRFYEIQNEESMLDEVESLASESEVILVSVDGHVLTAPVSGSEDEVENVQTNSPEFHPGPGDGPDIVEDNEELCSSDDAWAAVCSSKMDASKSSSDMHIACSTIHEDTNATGSKIEVCEGEGEGEGEQVYQAQETQNVVDHEADILTQKSAEVDTHDVCSSTKDDIREVCEGEDEPVHQAQETENAMNQEADIRSQISPEEDASNVCSSTEDDINAIINNIEVCEGEDEQTHQAQETENIMNREEDICSKRSPEGDARNVCRNTEDGINVIRNTIEVREGGDEPVHQAQETENIVNQEADTRSQRSPERDACNVCSSAEDDINAIRNNTELWGGEDEPIYQAQETENVVNQEADVCSQRSSEGDDRNVRSVTKDDINDLRNKIEVCEGEDKPVHQAQETENVENQEADIHSQRSAEGDTQNVCSSAKDYTNAIDNKIEVCEGEGEQVHQLQETHNVVNQGDDLTERSEEELAAIKKAEAFRSSVVLPALVTKVQNTHKVQEKSKDRCATESRNSDELSASPSCGYSSTGDSVSPELHTAIGPIPLTAFGREHVDSDSTYAHSVFNDPIQGIDYAHSSIRFEISLCGSEIRPGMGLVAAAAAFDAHRVSREEFRNFAESVTKNEDLIVRFGDRYLTWQKAAPIVLGMAAFGLELPAEVQDEIPVKEVETGNSKDDDSEMNSSSLRRWRLWKIPFRRVKTLEHASSNSSNEDIFVDSVSGLQATHGELFPLSPHSDESPLHQFIRTNVPSNEQIESLNLKEGQNMITFSFSTRVLGMQQVDAHIYLWMWDARIVISDVDGTITKSDVLGQFMPLVGKDWSQSGVAQLFSAIKENGYQLLFLSARAIVQAYLTRSFLLNLKQDGKALPNGPVVISPDGLFPSLFREVIRRAPHEFKIACLEDIKKLFPSDYNPFYAGFGNRDTDELSYRKIGIPKGKIFIINPKGEVAISRHCVDVKSYTSLHTLVNDMFPPTSLVEQEDYNNWNYWRMPLPEVDDM